MENKLSLGNTPKGEPFGDQTKKTEHEEKNLKGVAPQVKTKKTRMKISRINQTKLLLGRTTKGESFRGPNKEKQ